MINISSIILSSLFRPEAYLRKRILLLFEKKRTDSILFSLMDEGTEAAENPAGDFGLIKGFLDGRERDFDQLVLRHKDMIFNLCMNIMNDYDEAVDASQEVFIKMYRNLKKFEFRSALSTWLYSIAVNTCRNRLASSYRKRKVPIEDNILPAAEGCSDPHFILERSEGEKIVREAVSKLPDDERLLIVMRDLESRSYEEISEITGINKGTVKSRISRGRHRLRGLLEGVI